MVGRVAAGNWSKTIRFAADGRHLSACQGQAPHNPPHVRANKALSLEVLDHPLYSPDLAPSDFHLHRRLQKHLRGSRSGNNIEIRGARHIPGQEFDRNFLCAGTQIPRANGTDA